MMQKDKDRFYCRFGGNGLEALLDQYDGIPNTIVQLIPRSTSDVIALSRPIRSAERLDH